MTDGVQAPLQQRSRKTFNNILDAAEQLMDDKLWTDVTITEIVRAAGCSVGSFYARFKDKESLLKCLSTRLSEQAEEDVSSVLPSLASLSLEQLAALIVDQLTTFYRSRSGLIRTLTLLPRIRPDATLREDGLRTAQVFKDLTTTISAFGIDPARASIGLFFVVNAIRESVLFPLTTKQLIDIDDAAFNEELSRALLRYLQD